MGTSQESFDQVKDILRKLDRSIDQARSRRLATRPPVRPSVQPNFPLSEEHESMTIGRSERPMPPAEHQGEGRPTNRARPLQRRDGDVGRSVG